MGERQKVSRKKKLIRTIRTKKTAILVAVFLITIILASALLFYIRIETAKKNALNESDLPALQVGQTKISKDRYKALLKQAGEQQIDEDVAVSVVQGSVRSREIARQLKLAVPDYLVAAQNQARENGIYIPYEHLSDYDKERLYPQALSVVLSLVENGGSLNAVLYAPYDDTQKNEEKRKYAEQMVNSVAYSSKGMSDDKGKAVANPFVLLLADFTTDQHINGGSGSNKSALVALTNDGRQVYGMNEHTAENKGVEVVPYDTELFTITKPLKKGEVSKVTKSAGRAAYVVIIKNEIYTKDDTVRARYTQVTQGLKN